MILTLSDVGSFYGLMWLALILAIFLFSITASLRALNAKVERIAQALESMSSDQKKQDLDRPDQVAADD